MSTRDALIRKIMEQREPLLRELDHDLEYLVQTGMLKPVARKALALLIGPLDILNGLRELFPMSLSNDRLNCQSKKGTSGNALVARSGDG